MHTLLLLGMAYYYVCLQVTEEIANRPYNGPACLHPRKLQLEWCRDGVPLRLKENVILTGSEDEKFLLLIQPTAPIDASCSGTCTCFSSFEQKNDFPLQTILLIQLQATLKW